MANRVTSLREDAKNDDVPQRRRGRHTSLYRRPGGPATALRAGATGAALRLAAGGLHLATGPLEHWKIFRTSNGIEPRFREMRRRTDAIGAFVGDARMAQSVFGLIRYFNRKYGPQVCREFRQSKKVACLRPAGPHAFIHRIGRFGRV